MSDFAVCCDLDRLNPEAGLLNKSSHSAAALGVTKFITTIAAHLVALFVLLKSDLDVQQTHLCPKCVFFNLHLKNSFIDIVLK
jgi:hypothetical protein